MGSPADEESNSGESTAPRKRNWESAGEKAGMGGFLLSRWRFEGKKKTSCQSPTSQPQKNTVLSFSFFDGLEVGAYEGLIWEARMSAGW